MGDHGCAKLGTTAPLGRRASLKYKVARRSIFESVLPESQKRGNETTLPNFTQFSVSAMGHAENLTATYMMDGWIILGKKYEIWISMPSAQNMA